MMILIIYDGLWLSMIIYDSLSLLMYLLYRCFYDYICLSMFLCIHTRYGSRYFLLGGSDEHYVDTRGRQRLLVESPLKNCFSQLLSPCSLGALRSVWLIIFHASMNSGWWFQTFFIFHNIWDNPSHWLIFFRWVKTTNQFCLLGEFPIFRRKKCRTFPTLGTCLINTVDPLIGVPFLSISNGSLSCVPKTVAFLVCPIFQAHPNYIRFGCMSLLLLLLWSYIYISHYIPIKIPWSNHCQRLPPITSVSGL